KKGMIGELLAHLLLNYTDNNFTSLSILKNKEEKSIKKGFDIIYCEVDCDKLWYSEVKSGKSESGKEDSNTYNDILLNRAKKGIIGELLAHLLLNYTDNNFTSLSILKNKEEKSIKKGFDIIYCEVDCDKLWYSEVKSGKSESGKEDSNTYNDILLNRAKKG